MERLETHRGGKKNDKQKKRTRCKSHRNRQLQEKLEGGDVGLKLIKRKGKMRKKKKRKKIPHDRQAQIRFPEKRPTEKKNFHYFIHSTRSKRKH